jgi:hypothetical protein
VITTSFGTLLGEVENQAYRFGQASPTRGLLLQLGSPFVCQAIKLGIPAALCFFPIGFDEASIFHSMQGGIQGATRDLNNVARDLHEALCDGVPVHWLQRNNVQDEKV